MNFRVHRPDWPRPFSTMLGMVKIFDQLLVFVSLYQHAENEVICSGEIIDLKILQSDWLRAFWPIS